MTRLLIASPRFHEYWRAIALAFADRGYQVRVLRYDHPTDAGGRARNAVAHGRLGPVAARLAQEPLGEALLAVARSWRPERILTVKGDLLGDAWWNGIAELGVPRAAWFYDEVRKMHHPWARLEGAGAIASYSPSDVAEFERRGIRASFVPLAFDRRARIVPHATKALTFIGARYPNRTALLRKLVAAGLPVLAVGQDWSRRPLDVVRSRHWLPAGVPAIAGVPREDALGLMAGSPATLNIHGDQAGCFTMRTFEAPGAGALQLIDRPDVNEFYEVGTEVLAFSSAEEAIDLAHRAVADDRWARGIREAGHRRTLAEHTFDHRVERLEQLWA